MCWWKKKGQKQDQHLVHTTINETSENSYEWYKHKIKKFEN